MTHLQIHYRTMTWKNVLARCRKPCRQHRNGHSRGGMEESINNRIKGSPGTWTGSKPDRGTGATPSAEWLQVKAGADGCVSLDDTAALRHILPQQAGVTWPLAYHNTTQGRGKSMDVYLAQELQLELLSGENSVSQTYSKTCGCSLFRHLEILLIQKGLKWSK